MDACRNAPSPTPSAVQARSALLRRIVLPAALLAWATALRVLLFSGFVLCDDRQELWTAVHVFAHGPVWSDQFQLRFGTWLFNVGAFKLFGISEFGFFAPTVLISASLGVVAYAILLRWGYALLPAFVAALMVAAAPFEVLMGTLRANDVILAWLVGLALAALVVLDERPLPQGVAVALLGWLAFYVKLWVVYFLPVLGLHYLLEAWRRGRWRGGVVFALASLVLHGATCAFWKRRTGYWLPFMWHHAATYPVSPGDLARVLRPPGTINHKYGKLVEVLHENGTRYNPSEFDWLLDLPTPARATHAGTAIAGQPDLLAISEHYGTSFERKSQTELAGAHPQHGSSTGDNFNVNVQKGLWHCWRHGTGGDALSLIAVCEGLLPCEDARAGALHGDLFKLAVGLANHKFQAGIQLGPSLLVGTQPAPTPPFDWELPTPFDEGQLPAFPVEVLPSWLAEYVQALAHATQTPTDLAGLLGLAAVATAMAQKVRVEVRQGYSEPVNVFVVAAMPPGSRKSPVFEGMMRPIQTHEEARMRQSAADIAKAETRYNIAKGELQQLQAKASKEENAVERMRLTEEAETLSAKLLTLLPPEKPRLVTDDTTPERLASLLAAQ